MPPELVTIQEDSVSTPCIGYEEQKESWIMVHDLLGGTQAMRKAAERWLPKEEREADSTYSTRLSRSFLYNGFSNTVDRLVAKPFSKPITRIGDLPAELEVIESNVDKSGTKMSEFARAIYKSALKYGRAHVLVDYPVIPATATKADEQNMGARPIMNLIEAPDLIGWRHEITNNGLELTQIRIREVRIEPVGAYSDTKVEYIRVFNKDTWELWRQSKDDKGKVDWINEANGTHTFGKVPLLSYYMNQDGVMCSKCPLEDLAWVNIRHWQSSSEQNNVLKVARISILFAKGFNDTEIKNGITISSNHFVSTEEPDADLTFVEHSGQAIGAGQDDLDKLELRMEVLGLKPLIERTSNSTATGKLVDEMSTHSNVQSWVRLLESFLVECMQACAKWMKKDLGEIKYNIFSDFGLAAADSVHLTALLDACIAGKVSDETFLSEYKRRAVLDENLDLTEELARLKAAKDDELNRKVQLAKATKPVGKQPNSSNA